MSAGVPVVTSEAPALLEVGGPATRSAPTGDAAGLARTLTEVVGDPARRSDMVATGRERAATFTWDGAAQRLDGLYVELCGGPSTQRGSRA
jgi:glycosyltransferase involved in cell wall biosynthesis